MKLEEIKGSYDLFVSLGSWCGPSLNLRRHQLRKYSFPLDWSISNSLSDVNRLLRTRFYGYMEIMNMEKTEGFAHFLDDGDAVFPDAGGDQPMHAHFIKDNYSNIISVHDFPIIHGRDWKEDYWTFKNKLTIRINRLYEKLQHSPSTLFLRWGNATLEEMYELESILSHLFSGSFKVIILLPTDQINDIHELSLPLQHVCAIQFPLDKTGDHELWDKILNGFSLNHFS